MNNRLSVKEAARLMGTSPQFIRLGLQQGKLEFGRAVKTSGRWTYWISSEKFTEITGINIEGGKSDECSSKY